MALALSLSACTKPINGSESSSSQGSKYRTPVFENPLVDHNCADPCIIRCEEDGYYYIYSTSAAIKGVDVYAPCYRSKDMVEVEFLPRHVLAELKGKSFPGLY